MSADYSKRVLLYAQVRRALQSGRYVPGQWVDPGMLAGEFDSSLTPIRLALHRLVGAGLLEDHARGGLHVPLPSEIAMRDHYDWMEHLLLTACDIGASPLPHRVARSFEAISPDDDLVKLTWLNRSGNPGAVQTWRTTPFCFRSDDSSPRRRGLRTRTLSEGRSPELRPRGH